MTSKHAIGKEITNRAEHIFFRYTKPYYSKRGLWRHYCPFFIFLPLETNPFHSFADGGPLIVKSEKKSHTHDKRILELSSQSVDFFSQSL